MTLDEAIKHAEDVAGNSCDKCGEEHRQLAEWLKELKRYKDKEFAGFGKRMMLKNKKWIFSIQYNSLCCPVENSVFNSEQKGVITVYASTEIDAYNMLIRECLDRGYTDFKADSVWAEDIG